MKAEAGILLLLPGIQIITFFLLGIWLTGGLDHLMPGNGMCLRNSLMIHRCFFYYVLVLWSKNSCFHLTIDCQSRQWHTFCGLWLALRTDHSCLSQSRPFPLRIVSPLYFVISSTSYRIIRPNQCGKITQEMKSRIQLVSITRNCLIFVSLLCHTRKRHCMRDIIRRGEKNICSFEIRG